MFQKLFPWMWFETVCFAETNKAFADQEDQRPTTPAKLPTAELAMTVPPSPTRSPATGIFATATLSTTTTTFAMLCQV
jgi:hypothetical protein